MPSFADFLNKRLCDVVFPGTHDAGIYGASVGTSAKTQRLDIGQQADVGVRYFDLRIITVRKMSGVKEQRAYHAPKILNKGEGKSQLKLLAIGDLGRDTLEDMLGQAVTFLDENGKECLIFRFSKCGDPVTVADTCERILGDKLFDGDVNLNVALLDTLKGKVITIYDHGEKKGKETGDYRKVVGKKGALPVVGTFGKSGDAVYDSTRHGLQYYGKFSDTPYFKENMKKQSERMATGPSTVPELLGMIYWTLTTSKNPFLWIKGGMNIATRNDDMWSKQSQLKDQWERTVIDHVKARAGFTTKVWKGAKNQIVFGRGMKSFMPNIVMVDFATRDRCDMIWGLNDLTPTMFAKAKKEFYGEED